MEEKNDMLYGFERIFVGTPSNSDGPHQSILKKIKPITKSHEALHQVSHVLHDKDKLERVLARLSDDLCKNREVMLWLISETSRSYIYVDESINDAEFRLEAVRKNGSVYGMLTDEQKSDPRMVEMCSNKFKETYEKTYERMLINSRFQGLRGKPSAEMYFISSADRACFGSAQLSEIKHDILLKHADKICEKLNHYSYENTIGNDYEYWLKECEEHCPEMKEIVAQYREEHWQDIYITEITDLAANYHKGMFERWLKGQLEDHKENYKQHSALTVDEVIDFVDQNRDSVVQAIADGKISMQGLADVLGVKIESQEIEQNTHLQDARDAGYDELDNRDSRDSQSGIDEISL